MRSIHITVNGEPRDASPDETLLQLLDRWDLRTDGVAVAVNLEVVPRGRLAERRLQEGDRVELVRAVGGG